MPAPDLKPIIVCVHGAWQDTSCFDMIRAQLYTYDYRSTAVPLPSTGASNPSQQTHLEDVIAIRNTLEQLILVGEKDVLLVLHSYGGIPGCGAIKGLEKSTRKSIGGRGGIIGCVFIAAILPLKGQSLSDVLKDWEFPYMTVEVIISESAPQNTTSTTTFHAQWQTTTQAESVANPNSASLPKLRAFHGISPYR